MVETFTVVITEDHNPMIIGFLRVLYRTGLLPNVGVITSWESLCSVRLAEINIPPLRDYGSNLPLALT